VKGRWRTGILGLAAAVGATCAPLAHAADPSKVLRLATSDIDTLDPQQWQDTYSNTVGAAIFEALYEWDYLGRPPAPVPNTAAAAPDVGADGRTWTIRIRPGIHFTDDPAFRGSPRELTAADYVYSIKRYLDPNLRGGGDPLITDLIVGMRPVVDAARKPGAKLDYDAPVAGLHALDRHTLQLRFNAPDYPVIHTVLTSHRAVAREVVEAANGDIQARAIGTGPYRLAEWKRGARVVLEANPRYRTLTFPGSDNPAHAAMIARMKGKALPQIGRVELTVIDEQQTRLLAFDQGTLDIVELRGEGAQRFLPNGKLDPALAARGIARQPYSTASVRSIYINMEDPVLGGVARERVTLRRALALGIDVQNLIDVVYAGQGLPAYQMAAPGVSGFDPDVRVRPYDPATANALLDRAGYGKRDAEGFRLAPGGKRLALTFSIFPGTVWRELQTLLRKNVDAIGVRMEFRVVATQDLFKEEAQGKFQLNVHGRTASPEGLVVRQLYGPEPPELNGSRFRNAEFDRALERFLRAPDETERLAASRTMTEVMRVYAPLIPLMVDIENAFSHPWVIGYFPSPFGAYYKYLDLDPARRR
jgi:ABC-type transport system substrate-binding protein